MNPAETAEKPKAAQPSIFSDRRKSSGKAVVVERRRRRFSPSEDWYLRVDTTSNPRSN